MDRPATVADRIWELWLDHRQTDFCWHPCTAEEQEYIHPRPLTAKSLADPECACVWKALDGRYDEGAVRMIFDAIQWHAEGPVGTHARTPHATRKRLGEKASRQALALVETIRAIWASATLESDELDCGRLPLEISSPMERALKSMGIQCAPKKQLTFTESFILQGVIEHFPQILIALSQGADYWASTKPVISEKGDNPLRLHFIRALTEDFRKHFGSPLREQVAALARCIYGGEMDAATVAKLAP